MDVLLQLQGLEALVPHNERTGDPLDPFARAISAISGKRKKSESDYWDMAKLEFLAGLYTDPVISDPDSVDGQQPGIPAMNIIRCLQDGATRTKRGRDVARGIRPTVGFVPLVYDGPKTPADLWDDRETFSLRKGVVISGRRVMRTRPIFQQWAAFLPIVADETIWDLHDLAACWENAGRFAGLADLRPFYGQFEGTLTTDHKSIAAYPAPDQSFAAAIKFIRAHSDGFKERHKVS